jgi:hypothetical protein
MIRGIEAMDSILLLEAIGRMNDSYAAATQAPYESTPGCDLACHAADNGELLLGWASFSFYLRLLRPIVSYDKRN